MQRLQIRTALRDETETAVGDLIAVTQIQRLQVRAARRDKAETAVDDPIKLDSENTITNSPPQ